MMRELNSFHNEAVLIKKGPLKEKSKGEVKVIRRNCTC